MSARARLKSSLPFRRVAVVLSGGGSYGAYEVGVLKVLGRLGIRPAIVAGVSVGAMNAVAWLAHDFGVESLEKVWRALRGNAIGIRWSSLFLRAGGLFVAAMSVLECILSLAGAPGFRSGLGWFGRSDPLAVGVWSARFEVLAWLTLGLAGFGLAVLAPRLEARLDRIHLPGTPERRRRWLGIALIGAVLAYALVLLLDVPWPRRPHVLALVLGAAVWEMGRRRPSKHGLRALLLRMLPETRGRGLWSGLGRHRVLEDLVEGGSPRLLTEGPVHLILSACAIESGRMSYFVNWPAPDAEFRARIERLTGDVVILTRADEVVQAAMASSAVPVVFEPWQFRGRAYLDGGVFSNQPLHAALADGADALLVVLVSPSVEAGARPEAHVLEVAGRLHQIANWRDLQGELRQIPAEWSSGPGPKRLCVIEPDAALPGRMLEFDSAQTGALIERGEEDAWRALERAGWIESSP